MAEVFDFPNNLLAPHPKQAGDEIPKPLGFLVDVPSISEGLDHMPEESLPKFKLAAADFIAAQVRKALWYPIREAGRKGEPARDDFKELEVSDPPTMEDLHDKQVADCIGFTLVTSIILDEAGIDHWVGFAQPHATIVIDSPSEGSLDLLDPLSPEIDQDLQPSLINSPLSLVREDMQKHGRAAIILNGHKVGSRSHGKSQMNPLALHPWLSTKSTAEYVTGIPDHGRMPQSNKIVMALFPPRSGQEVLVAHSKLIQAKKDHDPITAAKAMKRIGPRYPNMDARNTHKNLRWVIANLASEGKVDEAKEMIGIYFETFEFIGDSRFIEAKADCLKLLARTSQDPQAAREAIALYEQAAKMPKSYRPAILKKLGKLSSQFKTDGES